MAVDENSYRQIIKGNLSHWRSAGVSDCNFSSSFQIYGDITGTGRHGYSRTTSNHHSIGGRNGAFIHNQKKNNYL